MRALHFLSLAYITAPVVIFLGGYLKPWVAVPLILLVVVSVGRQLLRNDGALREGQGEARSVAFHVTLVALVVAFAIGAGFGGFAAQDGDYGKHNAFFKDLMELDWPLAYQQAGAELQPLILNTYIGYYLPAALVGKLLGVKAGFAFSFVWAVLGMYLAIRWFLLILGERSLWLALLFLFFGGIDLVGYVVVNGQWPGADLPNNFSSWMWPAAASMNGIFWIFPSNPGILANGPHHVLPSWVALLMMMHDAIRRQSAGRAAFLWATTTYVSAFFAIGMLPYLACAAAGRKVRELFTFENTVVAVPLALVAALYIASNDARFIRGFVWEFVDPSQVVNYLLLFYVASIGLYLVFWPTAPDEREPRGLRTWLYVAVACVLAFPLYRIGLVMEFPIKAWLPTATVFLVCFAAALALAWRQGRRRRAAMATVLAVIGCFSGVSLMAWAGAREFGLGFYEEGLKSVQRVDRVARTAQLFSGGESFFWKHLGAQPVYYKEKEYDSTAATRYLSVDTPSLLHERFVGGELPPGGFDTRKQVTIAAPLLSVEVLMLAEPRQSSPWAVLVSNELRGAGFAAQQLADRNNQFYLGIAGRPAALLSSPVAVTPGIVNYVVFCLSGGRLTTYVNGEQRAVDAAPPGLAIDNSPAPVQIGNGRAMNRVFKGRIFEVRIAERSMAAGEVAAEWARISRILSGARP
jgi:hypothetical protein